MARSSETWAGPGGPIPGSAHPQPVPFTAWSVNPMSDTTPSVAEIAALTARLRALSNAGPDADPQERARFLADKDALLARIAAQEPHPADAGDPWADYRTYTPTQAADELVARGVPPDAAPALVDRYLDGLTHDRGWSPQDQWEIDDDDLAAMLDDSNAGANLGLTGAEGPPLDAGPALTAEEAAQELAADGRSLDEARALVRGYLDDVSQRVGASADLWGLDDADLTAIRSCPPASSAAAASG